MHIRAPRRLDRVEPAMSRRTRRRRALGWMLGGSALLHLLLLSLFLVYVPSPPPPPVDAPLADQVQMLFQPPSPDQASSASDKPDVAAAVPSGTPTPSPPAPDQTTVPPAPSPAPQPPPPEPAPVGQQPVMEASIPQQAPDVPQPTPPTPEPPQPQTATPPPLPRPPPTVSLQVPPPDPSSLLNLPPPFVPPDAPLVLQPRPAPPRVPPPPRSARVQPQRSPFGFPAPQNWSFNAAPSSPGASASRHGFDTSVTDQAGRQDTSMQYVGGAHPGADWEAKVHAWIAAHSYYPEEAASQGHQGVATVFLRIDRTGRVLSVRLISSSGEPFLDGAWVDAWRGGVVPPFPPGVTDDVAEFNYTVFYKLVRR